jgi:hypothetical protein
MHELIKRGEYKVIRTDGAEIMHFERPHMRTILKDIGAEIADVVILDSRTHQVMFADEEGELNGRPVNEKATALYRSVCKPDSAGQIHGDAVMVNDLDFAAYGTR